VLRFVGPVLREREHVADQAKRARLAGTSLLRLQSDERLVDFVSSLCRIRREHEIFRRDRILENVQGLEEHLHCRLEELRALGPPVVAVHGNMDEPALRESLPKETVVEPIWPCPE